MKTSYSRQLLASGRVTCVAVSALHTMSRLCWTVFILKVLVKMFLGEIISPQNDAAYTTSIVPVCQSLVN